MYIYGFSEADVQRQIPVIHPVIDYANMFDRPIFGGEFGYRANLTSLSREAVSFNPITATGAIDAALLPTSADPTVKTPANCLLRGIAGNYTRLSARSAPGGDRSPIRSARSGRRSPRCAPTSITPRSNPAGRDQLSCRPATSDAGRVMPAVGVEYRYPFISVQPWGTQTIEPIAQVIVRPNEQKIGQLPNEDAQSLVFDDTNLFSVNKFSGWDRSRRRRPRQCRHPGDDPVRSRRLRQFPVRPVLPPVRTELVRGRRPDQHRPQSGLRQHPLRLCRARVATSRTARYTFSARSRLDERPSKCAASNSKTAPTSSAGRSACSTATTTSSRNSGSSIAAKACSARRPSRSPPTGWCPAARATT